MVISIQGASDSHSTGFSWHLAGQGCLPAVMLSSSYTIYAWACSDTLSGARPQGVTPVSVVGIQVLHQREKDKRSEARIETWARARHRHGVFLTAGEPPPSQRLPL